MTNNILNKTRLVHVYTGEGKGKTTAALGLALRACGHNWHVLIIQFMKRNINSGEILISKKIPNLEIKQFGLKTFVNKKNPSKEDIISARNGFLCAEKAMIKGNYDLIILDEINIAVDYDLIPLSDLIKLIRKKPDNLELVLTGRAANIKIIELADIVSKISEVKHPFHKGTYAREGIDY